MKPFALLSFLTLATALVSRDDTGPYKKVIDSITDNVDKLDTAVNNYNGQDKQPVVDASNQLVKSIDEGTDTINNQGSIKASDALGLTSDINSLKNKSNQLTKDIKAKRGAVEKAKECGTVRNALDKINNSAQKLVDTTVSKLPEGVQGIAKGLTSDFTNTFDETKDYFSESNCKNGDTSNSDDDQASNTSSGGSASPSNTSAASGLKTPAAALAVIMLGFAVYF